MRRHPFRKSFGLFVLYCLLIIGIFVLQFRNESVVSQNIGLLSISLAQTQQEDGHISLKNSLQVNFKGISFIADEVTPAQLIVTDESGARSEKKLTLISYSQETPLSYTFHFSEGVSLTFAVSDTKSTASLSVNAMLPGKADGLSVQYKPASGFSVTEKSKGKLILTSKNQAYALSAPQIDDQQVFFPRTNLTAFYALYSEEATFTFASIDTSLMFTQKSTYDANIKNFRDDLISAVTAAIHSSQTLSEKSVIAYIAERADQNHYAEALAEIPDSFKKGNKRTYLSAPFFNNLSSLYPSLEMHSANMAEMISNAADSSSLSIFTVDDFADFLTLSTSEQNITKLLALPAHYLANQENPIKLSQATGILQTYLRLSELHSNLADQLVSVIEPCVKIIEAHCVLTDSALMLMENEVPVSHLLALQTGKALIQLGTFNATEEYNRAGYALVNSVLSASTLDIITLADAYPILVNNSYYPHIVLLQKTAAKTIWAWTCANSIAYSAQNDSATITTKFPRGESHYIMVSGIDAFTEIEIYGLSFHSDPRFEAYNSSGFIYRDAQKALLLKSRHKSEIEVVRLFYKK